MLNAIVVIGAGLCGARAALALREQGFAGSVTLIGDEAGLPYDRPPLSKQGLVEAAEPTLVADRQAYLDGGIELIDGTAVERLDRAAKQVILDDGRTVAYDKLLLATGAHARSLPNSGHLKRLHTLRTHADAIAIHRWIGANRRLIVIGGGFIGLEVAAAARLGGTSVTVIEGLPRLMARAVPEDIAARFAQRHSEEGVEFIFNAMIVSIAESDDHVIVTLADGRQVCGDAVVAGIGALPNTGLAAESGLLVENGIVVDDFLQTSDPAIYAAGDCCSFPLEIYGGRRVRLESWRSAQNQGVLVAANLLGKQVRLADIPWFWSDQYDLALQIVGLPDMGVTVVRRDIGVDSFILFHLDADGRLMAASGIGHGNSVSRDIKLAEMLIAARACPDATALSSPAIRLKSLLAA